MALRTSSRPASLVCVLAIYAALAYANTSTQSAISLPAFKQMDPCAQACFYYWNNVGCDYLVEDKIGCSAGPCGTAGINDCYCRGDKQPVATDYLSSCISSACTVGDPNIDVSSGVGIYVNYCASLGYQMAAPVSVSATSTLDGSGSSSKTTVSPDFSSSSTFTTLAGHSTAATSVNQVSSTTASGSTTLSGSSPARGGPSSSSNGLSPSDIATIIGTVIGAVALFLAVLTFAIKWHQMTPDKRDSFRTLS